MTRAVRTQGMRAGALWVLVALTLLILLAWQHEKPLNQDEVFVLQTESVATLRQLVEVQRHTPIALDPLLYHLLAHTAVSGMGATALAIRLPSILGFLLMQVCLFAIARRVSGAFAGLCAAALPAISASLYYGAEARPYGLLLGLSASVLWAWQGAVRLPPARRRVHLPALAVALCFALNTHYFAVLLLPPLFLTELWRTLRRRSLDIPVLIAMLAGSAGVLGVLPFQAAAARYREHYYNTGQVSFRAITQAYRALLVNYTHWPSAVQAAWMAALLLLALLFGVALLQLVRSGRSGFLPEELLFLLLLSALPFGGFLLARFATHSFEVRYVLPALVGLSVLAGVVVASLLSRPAPKAAATGVLLLAVSLTGLARVREEHRRRVEWLATMEISPEVQRRVAGGQPLLVQNMGRFEEGLLSISDPLLRRRVTLLYSPPEEIRWLQHDTEALTATNMRHFTSVPTVEYESLRARGGTSLLVLYPPSGWDWVQDALKADGAERTRVGRALGGEVYAVRWQGRSPG